MKLILACDPRGGIGFNNSLPWDHIDGDLLRFRKLTQDGIVVMGRNTWLSLPKKPLPNRLNFVVTSKNLELPEGAIAIKNLSPFENHPTAWLIGGAQLINSSWDYIGEVHLTRTYNHYDCDSFVDLLFLESKYNLVHITNHKDHSYEIWERKDETVSQST